MKLLVAVGLAYLGFCVWLLSDPGAVDPPWQLAGPTAFALGTAMAWRALRAQPRQSLLPALITLALVPLPHLAPETLSLTLALQHEGADVGAALLRLVGIPAKASAVFIDTPTFTGIVTDACAGTNMHIAVLLLALAVAHFTHMTAGRTLAFAVVSLVFAHGANLLRIAALTALGHHHGPAAVDQPLVHDLTGVVTFVGAFSLSLALFRRRDQSQAASSPSPLPQPTASPSTR